MRIINSLPYISLLTLSFGAGCSSQRTSLVEQSDFPSEYQRNLGTIKQSSLEALRFDRFEAADHVEYWMMDGSDTEVDFVASLDKNSKQGREGIRFMDNLEEQFLTKYLNKNNSRPSVNVEISYYPEWSGSVTARDPSFSSGVRAVKVASLRFDDKEFQCLLDTELR